MSYYFTLNFKEVKDLGDAMRLAKSCTDWIVNEHAETVINRNKLAIPSNQFIKEREKITDWWFWETMNLYWLKKRFIFNFLYFEEYNLLALNYNLPEPQNFFPFSFELNSTCVDIDYNCEFWGNSGLNFFVDRVNKVKAMTDKEVRDKLEAIELIDRYTGYVEKHRDILLYDMINQDLDLDGLIYGGFTFEQFSLSAIIDKKRLLEINKIMEKYIQKG